MTERQSLIYRYGDLMARQLLIDLSDKVFAAGNLVGACHLLHAEVYLADRRAYERSPLPPGMVPLAYAERVAVEIKSRRRRCRTR